MVLVLIIFWKDNPTRVEISQVQQHANLGKKKLIPMLQITCWWAGVVFVPPACLSTAIVICWCLHTGKWCGYLHCERGSFVTYATHNILSVGCQMYNIRDGNITFTSCKWYTRFHWELPHISYICVGKANIKFAFTFWQVQLALVLVMSTDRHRRTLHITHITLPSHKLTCSEWETFLC